jgi:hypothetical protein
VNRNPDAQDQYDGILDLAAANNTSSGAVTVLMGRGDGTFGPPASYAAGYAPYSLAAADFNGDGILDLAAGGPGGVRVLLANGDGSFQSIPVDYAAGNNSSLAVGDFNSDGYPDLATASVSILFNDASWQQARPGRRSGHSRAAGNAAWIVTITIPAAGQPERTWAPDVGLSRSDQSLPASLHLLEDLFAYGLVVGPRIPALTAPLHPVRTIPSNDVDDLVAPALLEWCHG